MKRMIQRCSAVLLVVLLLAVGVVGVPASATVDDAVDYIKGNFWDFFAIWKPNPFIGVLEAFLADGKDAETATHEDWGNAYNQYVINIQNNYGTSTFDGSGFIVDFYPSWEVFSSEMDVSLLNSTKNSVTYSLSNFSYEPDGMRDLFFGWDFSPFYSGNTIPVSSFTMLLKPHFDCTYTGDYGNSGWSSLGTISMYWGGCSHGVSPLFDTGKNFLVDSDFCFYSSSPVTQKSASLGRWGAYIGSDATGGNLTITYDTPLRVYFELASVPSAVSMDTRIGTYIGNYIVGGDTVNNVQIVNETTNIYNNPATGVSLPIIDWTYDYGDRSYEL